MPNVVKLPGVFKINALQVIRDFDYADFCALLESESADIVTHINGLTILSFDKVAIICSGGQCTSISAPGASVDYLLREAHDAIDAPAARAAS